MPIFELGLCLNECVCYYCRLHAKVLQSNVYDHARAGLVHGRGSVEG